MNLVLKANVTMINPGSYIFSPTYEKVTVSPSVFLFGALEVCMRIRVWRNEMKSLLSRGGFVTKQENCRKRMAHCSNMSRNGERMDYFLKVKLRSRNMLLPTNICIFLYIGKLYV